MNPADGAATARYAGQVAVGEEIGPLRAVIGNAQMFFFSAAVYNGHRIHYDQEWATGAEGYPGMLIQGHLQSALMAKAIADWMGGWGRLVRYAVQHRGPAFAGETLAFLATVTGIRHQGDVHLVDLDLRVSNADGQVIMPGTATVALPARRSGPEKE